MKRSMKNSRPFTLGETMDLTSYITRHAYQRGYDEGFAAGMEWAKKKNVIRRKRGRKVHQENK